MPKIEPMRYRRYRRVRRGREVAWIASALERSGATILERADPDVAPFEFRVRAPSGEVLDLVCYAFSANKYEQGGRSPDEHRFQIKYGSDFHGYHSIFIDPSRRRVTLMFGVHLEMDLAVAVDPAMHNPTRFSSSVEFKTRDLEQANEAGWYGWQRERSEGRRKRPPPMESMTTEVVLGLRPEHFLSYVYFERVATGMDSGERLLLIDRIGGRLSREAQGLVELFPLHPLEELLSLRSWEILDVIMQRFRLLAAVRGSVAEHHLGEYLRNVSGISDLRHLDKDGQPDFEFLYRSKPLRVECKNVLRRPELPPYRVDFQKTRASIGNPCSRYYMPSQFEILAACLHPVTQKWEFRFCSTNTLPEHKRCKGRLSEHVLVAEPSWVSDLPSLLT